MAKQERAKQPKARTRAHVAEPVEMSPHRADPVPESLGPADSAATVVPDLDARDRGRTGDRKAPGPPKRREVDRAEAARESSTDEVSITDPAPADVADGDQ